MRRFGFVVLGAVLFALLTAVPALAQGSNIGPPDQDVGPQVIVRGAPGGVAFTGSQVTVWMVLAAMLLATGVTLLIAGRRRAKAAARD